MRHLMETKAVDSPPTLHGIPFTITLTYQKHIKTSTDKSRKKRRPAKHTISTDRMDKLIGDIETWRNKALRHWVKQFSEITAKFVFPDSRIVMLAHKVKNIGSEDDLIAALQECGYSIPGSFMTEYTSGLYSCISNSLKESHPQPQLQEQFDQAAGRVVKGGCPAEQQAAPISPISQSTPSTPSILPCPQQRAPVPGSVNLIPSIVKQHTLTLWIPHWPIPSIPQTLPFPQCVPLAEKPCSEPGAINVPVEQLPVSQSDMVTQLPTVSSTSVNDREINLSKQKNSRKRNQPSKENSVPAGKKRKP